MIEVRCDQTGDSAEAQDELSALVAARELTADAYSAHSVQGYKPTASFFVDGVPVPNMHRVTQPSIWRAIGAACANQPERTEA